MRKRVSQRCLLVGDVLEIRTKKGFAYAQCTHREAFHGPLIRVVPGFHKKPLADLDDIANIKESYYIFLFWGKHLVDHRKIYKIGRAAVPDRCKPFPLFKAGNADPKTRKVATWWLWDGKKEWRVGKLTKRQKELPICETLNYIALIDCIVDGWHPRDDA